MSNELHIYWVDEDGVETRSTMSVNTADVAATEVTTLIDNMQALSQAAISRYEIVNTVAPDPAIPAQAGGPYDAKDKLILEATTSAGAVAKLAFPAPDVAYLDDSDQVNDIAGLDIVALFDAMKAIWSRDSQTLVTLLRGYRIRTKNSTP